MCIRDRPGCPYGRGPADALKAALQLAEGMGFAVQNDQNIVGTVDLAGGPPRLDILAHLDVVPAGDGWQVTAPYVPKIVDGRLYGRGSSDDKGPAIAALYAMHAVKTIGAPLSGRVRLILGTDEECGSSDLKHYYEREPEAPMSFAPDAEFPVINVEKGRFTPSFEARFEPDHTLPRIVSVDAGTKIRCV